MYKPKFFKIDELVDKQTYGKLQDNALIVFDDRILKVADLLRIRYGKIKINDWKWNGNIEYAGFRPFNCKIGEEFSQHKFGRAIDFHFLEVENNKVLDDLLNVIVGENKDNTLIEILKLINTIELNYNRNWIHLDTRNLNINAKTKLIYSDELDINKIQTIYTNYVFSYHLQKPFLLIQNSL